MPCIFSATAIFVRERRWPQPGWPVREPWTYPTGPKYRNDLVLTPQMRLHAGSNLSVVVGGCQQTLWVFDVHALLGIDARMFRRRVEHEEQPQNRPHHSQRTCTTRRISIRARTLKHTQTSLIITLPTVDTNTDSGQNRPWVKTRRAHVQLSCVTDVGLVCVVEHCELTELKEVLLLLLLARSWQGSYSSWNKKFKGFSRTFKKPKHDIFKHQNRRHAIQTVSYIKSTATSRKTTNAPTNDNDEQVTDWQQVNPLIRQRPNKFTDKNSRLHPKLVVKNCFSSTAAPNSRTFQVL